PAPATGDYTAGMSIRKTEAIRIHEFGGPEALRVEEIGLPAPGPAEVLIRHTAIGLNFIDTYHRSGLYAMTLPAGIGSEAAGVVEEAGADSGFSPGDRVAYAGLPPGAYARHRVWPAEKLVRLPDEISDEVAA